MTHPIIGWEQEEPVPDGYAFTDYLVNHGGHLHLGGVDLAQLFLAQESAVEGPIFPPIGDALPSPLEVAYLPLIPRRIDEMRHLFAELIAELGYEGQFLYTYASKANAAEEIIRTTLKAGAHHEMSSGVDVDIARLMIRRGLLAPDRLVICNGFKGPGSSYATKIVQLKGEHESVIPVIEDLPEISPLLESGKPFQVGLRQKSYGHYTSEKEMKLANSRFGLSVDDLWKAADYIAAAPNLSLKMYHYMVGSQLTDPQAFLSYLKPGLELYARLKQRHPSLHIFNFGGGMPVRMTLDFDFNYREFVRLLLTTAQEICGRYHVPVPDIMGEFGRYTTSEHGAHLFKIIAAKENDSEAPWYIIDGSIMSSFPDSWALGEHFIVLPLNHLDKPFQLVQLGGITCDSDDVYPPQKSESLLYLPTETDDLYIGFFSIGAYQEMLGGVRGSKHCVLPEAMELIIDKDTQGRYLFDLVHGQTEQEVMRNLGYRL